MRSLIPNVWRVAHPNEGSLTAIRLLVPAVFILGASCRGTPPPLGTLASITRADVRKMHPGDSAVSLTDSLRLQAIADALNQEHDGWHASWHTQPAGDLSVQFFRGDSSLGVLWIGPQFLAERGTGPRVLKQISSRTEGRLRHLLDPPWPRSSPRGRPS